MNEQIKAVGRQAGLVFIDDGVYGQRWYSSKCGLDALEYEKLVKLIVLECATQAEEESSWPYSSFGKKIKQHFGVE